MKTRWISRDFILAAAVLLVCAAALAQEPGGAEQNPAEQQPPDAGSPPMSTMPPGNAMPEHNPQSIVDQAFLRKTLEDAAAQAQMGQLALQKSESEDVKEYAGKLAQVQQQLTDEIVPVAKKLSVDQPSEPSKKDRQKIETMQSLSGSEFDAAFIRAMMQDQREDLKGFKDEAEASQDPDLQQLTKLNEPVLSQHLDSLEQIAHIHNIDTAAK